ncbi:hypothetical protein C8Q79DRAFT_1012720 [Trametes meyenii]|nr:hypothetical protein C8Q79DRAFT_1012720 [Trametes meyenii]
MVHTADPPERQPPYGHSLCIPLVEFTPMIFFGRMRQASCTLSLQDPPSWASFKFSIMSSSDEATVWHNVGTDTLRSFVSVTVETFLIAIYSVLVFMTACFLMRRKSRTKAVIGTTLAVFLMYGGALALWMIDIHTVILEIQKTLLSTPTDALEDSYSEASVESARLAMVEDILYAYLCNVGDAIIIWRVYALWCREGERRILLLPVAFFLGSLSMSLSITYCATQQNAKIDLGAFTHPPFCLNIQTASYSMTLATTAVATALIAYKAWEYSRVHREAFGKLSRPTKAQRVMVILVESGVLYMLFFLVQVIGSLRSVSESIDKRPTISFGFMLYDYTTSIIVGMYPTIIVILVHLKYSILEDYSPGNSTLGEIARFRTTNTRRRGGTSGGSGTYLNSASSVTCESLPKHGPPNTVNLYEMAILAETGHGVGITEDKDGVYSIGARQGLRDSEV